jgi:VWFA-related protein
VRMNTRKLFTILSAALILTTLVACGGGGGGGDGTAAPVVPPTNPPPNPPPATAITVSLNQIITDCVTNAPTNNVVALVTVNDQNGNPVDSLTAADFTLFEGPKQITSAPPENLTVTFADQTTIPLSVAMVLDFSWSIGGENGDGADLAAEKVAAVGFVNLLLANDEAEIVKFGKDIDRAINFTLADAAGKQNLATAINEPLVGDGNGSAVYDAIILALEDTAARLPERRKAIVVLTDGEDTSSQSTIDDVIALANLDGIPVFTIGLGDKLANFEANLKRIADETGGVYYASATAADLTDIYNQLAETLIINQYVFQYNSSLAPLTLTDLMVEATYNTLVGSDTRDFELCP